MSTENKPSKNEEEYFAQQDRELLEQQRAKARAAAEDAERRSHLMKCPKDGYDLETVTLQGVQIETCGHCRGIWLDAGELETIEAHHDRPGLLGRVLHDLFTGMGRGPRSKVG
ncbi:MAG TPA: zf-TFIIB domain-containing protein [Gemmatimonadales bacterium]|nr:zf-TFIIB domain-containing protein [Gemmatimonadales bacterium]